MRQWDRQDRVGVHGTGADHPPPRPARARRDFSSAEALVRWFLNEGREKMEGSKAIEYRKDAGKRKAKERDFWKMEDTQERFAFAAKAMAGISPADMALLVMAYRGVDNADPIAAVQDRAAGHTNHRPPLSDEQIADRLGCSRRTVTDRRCRLLAHVRSQLRELGEFRNALDEFKVLTRAA